MKNKYIVTITDASGSRQYSVHKIIKKIAFFTFLTFVLIGVMTFFYIQFIHTKVDQLKEESKALNHRMMTLEEERKTFKTKNDQLNKANTQLVSLIQENNDKLSSMKQHLKEVEEMIGIGPDVNMSLVSRVDHVREYKENQMNEIKKNILNDIQKEKISAIQKTLLLNSIPNGKPLNYRRISSNFGYRTHPVTKKKSFHAGLDLPAKYGTPIYAPASGTVIMAGKKGAYGNFLLLTHAYGFKTAYGHLSRFAVKGGDFVNKGQVIAYVGSTGRSTGPHLHYEIRYLTKWLDPKIFINWDINHIKSITKKINKVNWKSIFKQTEKLINLSQADKSKLLKSI